MSDDATSKINSITLTCEQVEALASDFIDGQLSQADRLVIEHHLKKCQTCASLISDIKSIISLAQTLAESPIPEGVKYRLRRVLQEKLGVDFGRTCLRFDSVK